jgi:hypothetical protein
MHEYAIINIRRYCLFTNKYLSTMAVKTQIAEKSPMTDNQAKEIKRLLEDSSKNAFDEYLKNNPSIDSAQRIIEQAGQFKQRHAALLLEFGTTADTKVIADWQKFYKDHFGLDVDFSKVGIPKRPKGNYRLLFIAKGMTMNVAFARCTELFPTWKYVDDLDAKITQNIRTASENYAVWVLDEVEPDKTYRGKSTKQVDPTMELGITVLERIIFEIKYFSETGKHLDVKGVTFCSGSRYAGGSVPSADWYDGKFRIGWYYLGGSDSDYGIRSAVSL